MTKEITIESEVGSYVAFNSDGRIVGEAGAVSINGRPVSLPVDSQMTIQTENVEVYEKMNKAGTLFIE